MDVEKFRGLVWDTRTNDDAQERTAVSPLDRLAAHTDWLESESKKSGYDVTDRSVPTVAPPAPFDPPPRDFTTLGSD